MRLTIAIQPRLVRGFFDKSSGLESEFIAAGDSHHLRDPSPRRTNGQPGPVAQAARSGRDVPERVNCSSSAAQPEASAVGEAGVDAAVDARTSSSPGLPGHHAPQQGAGCRKHPAPLP